MERLTTGIVAAALAVGGFIAGIALAALLGLHEPLHVFSSAIVVAVVAGVAALKLFPLAYRRFATGYGLILLVAGLILLVGAVSGFVGMIS